MFKIKNFIAVLFCLYTSKNVAQELVFSTGSNHTAYDYKNSQGETNSNIRNSSGNFYELGFFKTFGPKQRLGYTLGIALNEFNAKGGNLSTIYTWETTYLGVKTGLSYALLATTSGFRADLDLALQTNTIIDGEQRINGANFDLAKEQEFNGLFLQPTLGMGISYPLTDKVRIGLGYTYGNSVKVSQKTEETLGFRNHQLRFSLNFCLKKTKGVAVSTDSQQIKLTKNKSQN